MIVAGVLRLGTLVRFGPRAVLTGFVNAVAVNIVLGQLGDFTGYHSSQGSRLTRALDTVPSLGSVHSPTVVLQGHDDLGSTFIQTLGRFHDELRAADGHLLLAGQPGDRR
jgi:MFS superfamily sulfate permease-like transporter